MIDGKAVGVTEGEETIRRAFDDSISPVFVIVKLHIPTGNIENSINLIRGTG